ncbi:hypothetical protein [Salinicoccus roseus]|uniref:Capsular polysaccharide biosynthesis protein n=2 Tax=Salinicoccus roseus TaxID=45670 RepID=A0ABT4YG21_9STAP|nr:hypothetical protein [Salinicoccus roseus]MDB0579513.1 hypothetical protein [Salinicoccus roseus]
MHFLKRNYETIILYILVFGVLGTIVARMAADSVYSYEAEYSLNDGGIEGFEENVSFVLDDIEEARGFGVEYDEGFSYISLTADEVTSIEVSELNKRMENLLNENGIYDYSHVNSRTLLDGNYSLKAIIIFIFLVAGLIAGLFHSGRNRRITTEKDVQYYLKQESLGSF